MNQHLNNLEALFWNAKQLDPGEEREAYIRDIECHDAEIALGLRKLLVYDAKADQIFGGLNERDGRAAFFPESNATIPTDGQQPWNFSSLRSGSKIGPYILLEPIGEGGMGLVYLAQQCEPLSRKVALKIIKPGMDSRQVIARFEAERQALAMMDHLHIAKVLDAGTTASGLPFFVMELVRGIPMTDYCDRAKLTTRTRLELFRDACTAIQHAHNKGIIHRDIKPSNVLVTEQDGQPLVKVIDFGVAKALTDNLTDKTLFTGMFQMLGTPLYMSPEQASLSNVDVDTRSDVYSLGAMLYELLSGSLPISREEVKGLSFDELRQRICDTDPPNPSKRLITLREQRETLTKYGGIDVRAVGCEVTSELDWIVMKAIEKDRQRRYQSAKELGDDVQRYLAGEAVQACPQLWSYRALKIARKHRSLIASIAVVVVAMTLGTLISLQQAIVAKRASALAVRNELAANEKAQQLKEMLYARDLRSASQDFLAGETVRLNQTLDRYRGPEDLDLRGFEFNLFDNLRPVRHELLQKFEGVRINSFTISPDGSALIGCHSGGRIFCLGMDGGDQLSEIDAGQGEVHDVHWDASGRLLSCGEDGSVALWQWNPSSPSPTECLRLIRRIQVCEKPLLAITAPARANAEASLVAMERSPANLAWAGGDGAVLYQIELDSGSTSVCSDGHSQISGNNRINDLVNADSTHVLMAFKDGTLKMADVSKSAAAGNRDSAPVAWTYRETPEMRGFRDVGICANGNRLVAGQLLGLVVVIDWQREPIEWTTQAFRSGIHSVDIDASGRYMAAGDSTGHIHLVALPSVRDDGFLMSSESRTRRVRTWKPHDGKIEQIRFSDNETSQSSVALYSVGRDGRIVCSYPFADPPVGFVDVDELRGLPAPPAVRLENEWCQNLEHLTPATPAILKQESGTVTQLQYTYAAAIEQTFVLVNRRQLVAASEPARPLWQAAANTIAVEFAVSPDGERFAVCVETLEPRRHRIEVFERGRSSPSYSRSSNLAQDMIFAPNGKQLAFVQNNDVMVLEAKTGALQQRLISHTDTVSDLEFSPDGSMLASVSADLRIILWDPATGSQLWSEQAHHHRANAVAFHPFLPTLATVGHDAMVRFWTTRDIRSETASRMVGEFPLSEAVPDRLRFSGDGNSLFVLHPNRGISRLETK